MTQRTKTWCARDEVEVLNFLFHRRHWKNTHKETHPPRIPFRPLEVVVCLVGSEAAECGCQIAPGIQPIEGYLYLIQKCRLHIAEFKARYLSSKFGGRIGYELRGHRFIYHEYRCEHQSSNHQHTRICSICNSSDDATIYKPGTVNAFHSRLCKASIYQILIL